MSDEGQSAGVPDREWMLRRMNTGERAKKIEALLRIEFPRSWAPPPTTPLREHGGNRGSHESDRQLREAYDRLMADIEVRRQELNGLTFEALEAMYAKAMQDAVGRIRATEAKEEQQRFFHRPDASADFEYWVKHEYWSMEESVALLLGKSPDKVNWKLVQPSVAVSAFAKRYERLHGLAARASIMQNGIATLSPLQVLAWAEDMDIEVPPELQQAVAARQAKLAESKARRGAAEHPAATNQDRATPPSPLPLAEFVEAVSKVEDRHPGVEWLTWDEAAAWLESETKQRWEMPRIVGCGVGLGVWVAPTVDLEPSRIEHLFMGKLQGFMAAVVEVDDRKRLQFNRSEGVLSITSRPDGRKVRLTPPVTFQAVNARVFAEDVKRLLVCVRHGVYPDKAGPLTVELEDGERLASHDPFTAARVALYGGHESLIGQPLERLTFEEVPTGSVGDEVNEVATAQPDGLATNEGRLKVERPTQALVEQEKCILEAIAKLGHSPKRLPKPKNGSSGVKADVRAMIGKSPLFISHAVFNKAWQRLRTDGEIEDD